MADRSQLPVQIMENQTRFDLNAAIENWRNELATQPNLESDNRRELETHLRDAIVGFQQRGLDDEESFWLARRRVGQPQQLGEEFVKADPIAIWRERLFWMWLALFLSSCLGDLCRSLFALAQARYFDTSSIPGIIFLIITLVFPLVAVILLANGKLIPPFSRLMLLIENRRRLAIAVSVCVVLPSTIRLAVIPTFFSSRVYPHLSTYVVGYVSLFFYNLVTGVILVWLLPVQNRKTSKRT
jgi:hypothetical protein